MNRSSYRLQLSLGAILLWVLAAVPSAHAQVSLDASVLDFGTCTGDTILRTVVLTNVGSATATVTLSDPDEPFFLVESQGEISLGLLETHSVTVGYAGEAGADISPTDTSEIVVSYEVLGLGNISGTVTLGLRASCPDDPGSGNSNDSLLFSDITINLGLVDVGGSVSGSLGIDNTSNADATVTIGGLDDPFVIVSGGGTTVIEGGGGLNVDIDFNPTTAGTFVDTLVIIYNVGDEDPDTVYVNVIGNATVGTGGGNDADVLVVSQTTLNFGSTPLNVPLQRTILLTNTDTSSAMINVSGSISGPGGPPFVIVSGGGAIDLSPGESQSVVVQFLPTVEGSASDSLVIDLVTTVNGAPTDTGRVVVDLRGEGRVQTGGEIQVDLSTEDVLFNNGDSVEVGVTVDEDITVTNSGDVPVTITVTAPNDPFGVSGGTRDWTIAPGDSAILTVSFTPMAPGNHSGTVVITWVDGENVITRNILLQGFASLETSGVDDLATADGMMLGLPVPNPVADRSTISFTLERGGEMSLVLYNLLGEEVELLARGDVEPGMHTVPLETANLQSGMYTVVLRSGGQTLSRTVTVQR